MSRRSRPPPAAPAGLRPPLTAPAAREVARLLQEGVAQHTQGRLDRAAALYRRVLQRDPGQADALHLSGLIAHQHGEHARALASIARAIERDGRPAAYWNSAGVVLLALDRAADAELRLREAIARDPLYPEAHNNLGNVLHRLERLDEAVDAYDRATEIRPDYAEAWCNRGRVLHLLDRPEAAAASLQRAVTLRPEWAKAHRYLGDALAGAGDRAGAEAHLRRALALEPGSVEAKAALAGLLERANRLEDALQLAEAALRDVPGHGRALLTAARAERRMGREEGALRRIDAADDSGRADADTAASLAFERGQILDRLGRYPEALDAFVEGNARLAATPAALAVGRDHFPAMIDRLRARFTREWVDSWTPPAPTAGATPVFLVGFPRSGTTLLDQVLDSHPALRTMEEKDALDQVRRAVEEQGGVYPDALAALRAEELAALQRRYAAEIRRHLGDLDGRIPVDKMPLNVIDAGLIHRLFPEARILLALRHPCDVVLSAFMQAMRPNAAMVLLDSLPDTARFYAEVMGLWLHYAQVLPLRTHAIRYEDLVADFPGQVAKILDFLKLPWDDAVLGYAEHAKARSIATPSYHQVVQPIYRRSVGRWRNYAAAFAPVLPVLQPFIDAFGYSASDG